MAKYIPKEPLVAEIDRRQGMLDLDNPFGQGGMIELQGLKDKLDTLEVKEVELERLEQEVKDFCYEYDDRKEKWYELCPNDRKLLYNPTWANFAMSIAKHFFELGMAVSSKT